MERRLAVCAGCGLDFYSINEATTHQCEKHIKETNMDERQSSSNFFKFTDIVQCGRCGLRLEGKYQTHLCEPPQLSMVVPKEAQIDYAVLEKKCTQQIIEPGTKFDFGKPPLDLISVEAQIQEAMVLDFGRKKYDAHNWRKGMSWSRVIGAALRHISAFNRGEDKDPETGLSHLAHARCCISFLLEYEVTHREFDDRYKVNNNESK